MSLVELLSKKKTLDEKIQKEEARVRTKEDQQLAELKSNYDSKQQQLNKWNSDRTSYLVDKPAVERFNAMLSQFVKERVTYSIEKDVARVSKEFLARIQPKSMSELIVLYKQEGVLDLLGNCDNAAVAHITEKEVLKAKEAFETLKAKITKRRTQ
jgi:hypothetical protein